MGIFQDYYQHELLPSYSASTIAWIPSLQIFFIMGSGPIVGKLHDRYGPRYLLLGGTVLHVFGLMMASVSREYYQILLSQGVCSAIGASALFQPGISSSWWYSDNTTVNITETTPQHSALSETGSVRDEPRLLEYVPPARAWAASSSPSCSTG